MSINYKEKYLKYKEKYFGLKNQLNQSNQSGGQPEMSNDEFERLCFKAHDHKTTEVLAAVDQDRRLATRACARGMTLLIYACIMRPDDPQLAQGLLERGANVHARNSNGMDALMWASQHGLISICSFLLKSGADPNSNNQKVSALSLAARFDRLQVCLLLISRGANLMLNLKGRTALDVYNKNFDPRLLSIAEIEQRRTILRTAFERGPFMSWKRRWPMMSVMAGCGFRPLALRLHEHQLYIELLIEHGQSPPPPSPIVVDTPEQRRAYYMQIIFRSDSLLRLIVSFL